MRDLRVAAVEMASVDDWNINFLTIERALQHVFDGVTECDLVCFPENALYMRVHHGEAVPAIALQDARLKRIAKLAEANQCAIHFGSAPLVHEERLYNSSILIRKDGIVEAGYRKMHLFDVDLENATLIRESDIFTPGERPLVFELEGWRIGSSICYDIRFAELYAGYARAEVDLILIPSAFLVETGRAHWEVLTRARAIESQAYVVAAAQGGIHQSVRLSSSGKEAVRRTWGRSTIVGPWGNSLAGTNEPKTSSTGGFEIIRASLLRESITKTRRQIPMHGHRRQSLFK